MKNENQKKNHAHRVFTTLALAAILTLAASCAGGDDDGDPEPDGSKGFVATAGSSSSDIGTGIVTDASGNTYVAGHFTKNLNFGTTQLHGTPTGKLNVFLAKYDNAGALVWAVEAKGSDHINCYGLTTDAEGNIYIGGTLYGTATFGSFELESYGFGDVFLVKYNPSGTALWARVIGTEDGYEYGNDMATDADGNTYIIGTYDQEISTGYIEMPHSGGNDIFLLKYNKSGNFQYMKKIVGGSSNDNAFAIAVDAAHVYVGGNVTGNATIGTTEFTGVGQGAFIAKFSHAGAYKWGDRASGSSNATTITVDNEGNTYMAGPVGNTITFQSKSTSFSTNYYNYLVSHNADGGVRWLKTIAGDGPDMALTSSNGKNYIASRFSNDIFIGNKQFNSRGFTDIYLAEFNKSGDFSKGAQAGGTDFEVPSGISILPDGGIVTTGFYHGTATFNEEQGAFTSAGAHDVFVWKYQPK